MNRLNCIAALTCMIPALTSAANGALRVGAAKIDITTAAPAAPATGRYAHERLYVRAIVLDNGIARAALITEDFGRLTEAGQKLLMQELDTPATHIVSSSIHTHSGSLAGIGPASGANAAVSNEPTATDRAILQAVRAARAELQSATVGFGTGYSYLNVNRDAIDPATGKWHQGVNPSGPSDKSVDVLMFKKPSGEPIAAYVTYAMHPVSGYVSGIVSADFPGAMTRYVEQAFADRMIVAFAQGASGDQNPLHLRPSTNVMASRNGTAISGYVMNREASEARLRPNAGREGRLADPAVMDNLLRFIESQGMMLGEEVIRVMSDTSDMAAQVSISGAAKLLSCPGRKRLTGSAWDNATREGVEARYEDAEPVTIQVGALRIGDIAVASSSGELYSQIGVRVKQQSPLRKTLLVTLINPSAGSNGYTPDDGSYGHQTFQALGTRLKQGCAETAIAGGIRDLLQVETR